MIKFLNQILNLPFCLKNWDPGQFHGLNFHYLSMILGRPWSKFSLFDHDFGKAMVIITFSSYDNYEFHI